MFFRFMPDGMYLDAVALGVDELAKKMNDVIGDKIKYYDFFKWHRYYSYHATDDSAETDEMCAFCEYLNNGNQTNKTRERDFIKWWFE